MHPPPVSARSPEGEDTSLAPVEDPAAQLHAAFSAQLINALRTMSAQASFTVKMSPAGRKDVVAYKVQSGRKCIAIHIALLYFCWMSCLQDGHVVWCAFSAPMTPRAHSA